MLFQVIQELGQTKYKTAELSPLGRKVLGLDMVNKRYIEQFKKQKGIYFRIH